MSPRQIAADALRNPAEYPGPGESLWVLVVGGRLCGVHVGDGSLVAQDRGWKRVEWAGPWLADPVSRQGLERAIASVAGAGWEGA